MNAFNDIEIQPFLETQGIAGLDDLRKVAILEVGTGNRAIKADPESGLWIGANKWADAPFRVAMDGTVVIGSGYSKITIFKQAGIPTSISVGDLWFDSDDANKVYRAASIGADQIVAGEWEAVDDQRAADALLKSTDTTLSAVVTVGLTGVQIDGANKRILINDGSNNRIVIGNV